VNAIAETLFPAGGPLVTTVQDADVVHYVDTLLSSLQTQERVLVRCLFTLFEIQLIVTQPRAFTRFSKASHQARTRSMAQWEKSPMHLQRIVFQAMRSLILWAYVDHPTVAKEIGIVPGTEFIARQNIRRAAAQSQPQTAAK
jgi:hypothetical protein